MQLSNSADHPYEVVRIGVTGHRFLSEANQLIGGIEKVCGRITLAFPNHSWQIISPLAEGADRLVTKILLAHGADLLVPLPLPVETYLEDFRSEQSKQEFNMLLNRAVQVIQLPTASTRNDAYYAAGIYVLEHSDFLIALWDGKKAQGKGGTGEIVDIARQKGIPLGWVHCGNRQPDSTNTNSLGQEQGEVTYERFE